MSEPDWESEGLLDGLEGRARDARVAVLNELHRDGADLEALRTAVAEQRLMFLPAERALGEKPAYSALEIAERSGLDYDFLIRQWQALGLPVRDPDEIASTEADLAAARRVKQFLDAGLPEDGIIEMARVLGQTMTRLAEASRFLIGTAFLEPGSTEHDVAQRARMAQPLVEMLEPTIAYVYRLQLLEQLRHDAMDLTVFESGAAGQREMTICFVDIVGWTRLAEESEEETIGTVADRLTALTSEQLRAPVRLIKMVGDGAMLVSAEARPMLEVALDLVEAAEADPGFPELRAGLASGVAVSRWGDWYGRPVNLASRVCSRARPGSVLVTKIVADACGEDGYRFSQAGEKRLKGIGTVPLWRVRREEGRA
jgi:adenylate cyclase